MFLCIATLGGKVPGDAWQSSRWRHYNGTICCYIKWPVSNFSLFQIFSCKQLYCFKFFSSIIILVKYFKFNSGLNQAATNFYSFEQGRIAAYRLFEMISRSSSTVNHDGLTLASVQGNIEFRNVYFSYLSRPEIPILSGFYLSVPAKKAVALVGRNGSGKSSIIPLMERFYDPTLGITFSFCYTFFALYS